MGRHISVAAFGVLQDAMFMSEPLCAGGVPLKKMGRHTGVAAFGVLPELFSNLFLQDAMCMSDAIVCWWHVSLSQKKRAFSPVG